MNKDNIKDYWHLLEALRDGKTVQVKTCDGWGGLMNPRFDLPPEMYRIKPEPVVKEVWMNVYPIGVIGGAFSTRRDCDEVYTAYLRTAYLYIRTEDGEMVEQKLIPIDGE